MLGILQVLASGERPVPKPRKSLLEKRPNPEQGPSSSSNPEVLEAESEESIDPQTEGWTPIGTFLYKPKVLPSSVAEGQSEFSGEPNLAVVRDATARKPKVRSDATIVENADGEFKYMDPTTRISLGYFTPPSIPKDLSLKEEPTLWAAGTPDIRWVHFRNTSIEHFKKMLESDAFKDLLDAQSVISEQYKYWNETKWLRASLQSFSKSDAELENIVEKEEAIDKINEELINLAEELDDAITGNIKGGNGEEGKPTRDIKHVTESIQESVLKLAKLLSDIEIAENGGKREFLLALSTRKAKGESISQDSDARKRFCMWIVGLHLRIRVLDMLANAKSMIAEAEDLCKATEAGRKGKGEKVNEPEVEENKGEVEGKSEGKGSEEPQEAKVSEAGIEHAQKRLVGTEVKDLDSLKQEEGASGLDARKALDRKQYFEQMAANQKKKEEGKPKSSLPTSSGSGAGSAKKNAGERFLERAAANQKEREEGNPKTSLSTSSGSGTGSAKKALEERFLKGASKQDAVRQLEAKEAKNKNLVPVDESHATSRGGGESSSSETEEDLERKKRIVEKLKRSGWKSTHTYPN